MCDVCAWSSIDCKLDFLFTFACFMGFIYVAVALIWSDLPLVWLFWCVLQRNTAHNTTQHIHTEHRAVLMTSSNVSIRLIKFFGAKKLLLLLLLLQSRRTVRIISWHIPSTKKNRQTPKCWHDRVATLTKVFTITTNYAGLESLRPKLLMSFPSSSSSSLSLESAYFPKKG